MIIFPSTSPSPQIRACALCDLFSTDTSASPSPRFRAVHQHYPAVNLRPVAADYTCSVSLPCAPMVREKYEKRLVFEDVGVMISRRLLAGDLLVVATSCN